MRLSVLFTVTGWNDTPGLPLPVRKVTLVVDDNMASFTGSLGADNALGRNNLSRKRRLVLVDIDGNRLLVPIRLGFQKVLLSRSTEYLGSNRTSSNDSGSGSNQLFGVIGSLDGSLGSESCWRGGSSC